MKEFIDINLITEICIKKASKRKEIINRLNTNLGITDLRKFFKKEDYSFSVYTEDNKIYFDKSNFISILCNQFNVYNIEEIDSKITQIVMSDILELPSLLPENLAKKITSEVEDLVNIKEALNSMIILDEVLSSFNTESKKIKYSDTISEEFKKSVDKKMEETLNRYKNVKRSAEANNLQIEKFINQLDDMYNKRIKGKLLNTYMAVKKEIAGERVKELTDQFVIENLHFEKLLYVCLVSAYKNNNIDYIEENIGKLTRGRISELTKMITEKYKGKNKEFLKAMKAFELAYGRSSVKKEELPVEKVDIHTFGYNFLALENKQAIHDEIEKVIEVVTQKYQQTKNDRYLVLYDKLQVIKELDIKELYIGKNSFAGYMGYKEEFSNIMLEKCFEDINKQIPAISEACYVVAKKDFETLAIQDKKSVIKMIKEGTIHAKRFYHNRVSEDRKNKNEKRLFKEKVLNAMRNSL